MNSDELAAHYVEVLRGSGNDIEADLNEDPPVILAYSKSGRVFAAAWPSEEGLVVRLRLDAMATDEFPEMEHIDGGTLAYEAIMRSLDEIDSFREMLDRAYELAARGSTR